MDGRYPTLHWQKRPGRAGRTALRIDLREPCTAEGADTLAETVEAFCAHAQAGAFAEASTPPGGCRCTLAASTPGAGGLHHDYEIDCHGIDWRSFQLLRNMLAWPGPEVLQVRGLTVAGGPWHLPQPAAAPLIDDDNEDTAYPAVHAMVAMGYADEQAPIEGWCRRALLYLHAPVAQDHVDAIESLVLPWFELLEAGAYALPVGWPWEVQSVGDAVTPFEEDCVEINVLRFKASEQAWASLGNLIWMNAQRVGLSPRCLVIDP